MIGIGAGQQSRIDWTKLASAKAAQWWMGMHPNVLGLRFKRELKKQDRINWRVRYIEGNVTRSEEQSFRESLEAPSEPLREEEKREWIAQLRRVSLTSDGSIPFRDNIDHPSRHGVAFIATSAARQHRQCESTSRST